MAQLIPWDEIEQEYTFMFPGDSGNVAKPVRMALGSLIIQARCCFTDRETVQQLKKFFNSLIANEKDTAKLNITIPKVGILPV